MTNTFKNIREAISSSQLKRLKKEYEPLRKIDMSKHKGQVDKTTAMLSKLKIGTLIDLYKENIPWISDIAKSLVKKDKRFAHHVEEVNEAVNIKALAKQFRKNEDENRHTENYLMLAKAFGSKREIMGVEAIIRRNKRQGHTNPADSKWMATNIGKYFHKIRAGESLEEGTWNIAKDMTQLKKAMRRPMRKGDKIDGGDAYSRNMDMIDFIWNFIGDDELADDLEDLKHHQDTRPAIKKAMKRLGIKEEVQLDEFTISDIQQMVKKGWVNKISPE
ncbi:uncharacterized protein METZ01_LOCUS231886, partial [marine metagenome]